MGTTKSLPESSISPQRLLQLSTVYLYIHHTFTRAELSGAAGHHPYRLDRILFFQHDGFLFLTWAWHSV